jgi:hypothetical protein
MLAGHSSCNLTALLHVAGPWPNDAAVLTRQRVVVATNAPKSSQLVERDRVAFCIVHVAMRMDDLDLAKHYRCTARCAIANLDRLVRAEHARSQQQLQLP